MLSDDFCGFHSIMEGWKRPPIVENKSERARARERDRDRELEKERALRRVREYVMSI